MDGWFSALHTIAWFPVTFALWVVPPVIVLAMLAGKSGKSSVVKNSAKPAEAVHA
jgi:hypothetical protein